jgi:hypothetical protein
VPILHEELKAADRGYPRGSADNSGSLPFGLQLMDFYRDIV